MTKSELDLEIIDRFNPNKWSSTKKIIIISILVLIMITSLPAYYVDYNNNIKRDPCILYYNDTIQGICAYIFCLADNENNTYQKNYLNSQYQSCREYAITKTLQPIL